MPGEPYYTSRAKFHADPQAQKLLKQFLRNGGEGGGAGRTPAFRAGYAYAFELSESQKRAVDKLREMYPELELYQAIDLVLASGFPSVQVSEHLKDGEVYAMRRADFPPPEDK